MNSDNSKISAQPSKRPVRQGKLLPVLAAFCATLFALPSGAIVFPDVPLQSGQAYPPANLMFVLDDSGSMNFVAMPTDVSDADDPTRYNAQRGLTNTIVDRSYVRNSIYYNPATTYLPWKRADGSRFTGGTAYDAAYWNLNGLTDAVNLGNATQTFFVPKIPSTASSTTPIGDYYRFQILTSGRIVRSATGGQNAAKGEVNVGCGNNSGDNGYDNVNGVYWRGCAYATPTIATTAPTSRTEDAEKINFATWYSYHRSRMKVAKAGASEAFAQVGENIRVGYNSIWNRNTFDIPVDSDGGLYRGTNKTTWFSRMQAASGSGGTPLHTALQRTGKYYETAQPWGPADSAGNTLSCRQNFTILTTDGYWNNTTGYEAVGDADGTAGPNGYLVASPYRDNFSTTPNTRPDTLADVAMHYWKTDLQADLDNDVPNSDEDPADWQHMVTFGVSIGLKGTLTPSDDTLDAITNGSQRWPDPRPDQLGSEGPQRIDDLWHASVNGRGEFMVASDSTQFTAGILNAINTVGQRQGSASNVTTNSTSFTTDTRVFQAKYLSGKWTGELEAYDATAAGVAATPAWRASDGIPAWGSRKIFTWNGSGGTTFPTAAQTTALDQSTRVTSPVSGALNVNYLKGDGSLEIKNNGELRNRDTVLGDIVNSSPVYVKDNETIFVGANDGMLHAFAAVSSGTGNNRVEAGTELFAYVPGGINLSQLATLSDRNYIHKHFVDGPVVASTQNQTPGRNYLIGALGRGGKGIYALNVTNPKSFAANNALWELNTGDDDLGQVLGEPLIATLNDTNQTKVVIFGNGINSVNGNAVLYVVNIANGTVLQRIDTGASGENGLSAPRGWDDDGNGTVDYVYAGDLQGNVWKFDFSATTGNGTVAYGGDPMFTTEAGQPITAGLALARDSTGKRWVFAGTGRFMTAEDPDDDTVQSMYALIDDLDTTIARSDLTERDIIMTGTVNDNRVRGFEAASELADGRRGWYMNLGVPTAGERVVGRPQLRGTVLIFSSIIPPKTTDDPCAAGGTGYLNAMDAFSGTSTGSPYFDVDGNGVVDDRDVVANDDGQQVPGGSIDPGVGMPTLPTIIDNLIVVGGSSGDLASVKVNPQGGAPRRVSWHEQVGD